MEATATKTDEISHEIGEQVSVQANINPSLTKALGEGVIEVVVSNSKEDRQGERIVMEGIDLKQIKRNPVVLYGHDYQGLPIGKITKIWVDGSNLKARIQLAVKEYPFAATVYDLIMGGYLNAVSIGGMVKSWSGDFTIIEELEMVELSIVPVGAHRDALVVARSLGKSADDIRNEFQEFAHKTMIDKIKGLDDDELTNTVGTLEKLVATLKVEVSARTGNANSEVRKVKLLTIRKTAQAVDKQAEHVIKLVKLKEADNG